MPKIRFADVNFRRLGAPERHDVEDRLKKFLANFRAERDPRRSLRHVSAEDRDKIERRVVSYFAAVDRGSGMGHLDRKDREKMEAFCGGVDLIEIKSEHQADEIASARRPRCLGWQLRLNGSGTTFDRRCAGASLVRAYRPSCCLARRE